MPALELKRVVGAPVSNSSQLYGHATSQGMKKLTLHNQKEAALIDLCAMLVSRGDNRGDPNGNTGVFMSRDFYIPVLMTE